MLLMTMKKTVGQKQPKKTEEVHEHDDDDRQVDVERRSIVRAHQLNMSGSFERRKRK